MVSKDLQTPPRGPASDDTTERQLAPGTQIRQYKITGTLRTGGMSRIYLALDLSSGERVAIKKPLLGSTQASSSKTPASSGSMETEILSRFRHPNVVRLLDTLEEANGDYLVLEYIEGLDLEAFLEKAGPGLGELAIRDLLLPIADALEALHRSGFIHRDVKPANLRIRPDGAPVLVDFGAAAPLIANKQSQSRWSAVTDGYAAPELYSDDHPEGPWCDVYSLAAIAYRAISGAAPASALDLLAGRHALLPALDIGRGRYGEGFLRAIDKGLELNVGSRPASVALWVDTLVDDTPPKPSAPSHAAPNHAAPSPRPPQQQAAPRPASPSPAPAPPPAAAATEPPVAAPQSSPVVPYPPTVEVRRRPLQNLRREPAAPPIATQAAAAPRRRPWGSIFILLLLLAGAVGGGIWFGWPYYLHNIKEIWIVDPSGKGDTTSISEALAQAKDGATIDVAPGTYIESLTLARPVRLLSSGVPGAAAIVAPESGSCLVATADSGMISGLTFRGAAPLDDTLAEPAIANPTPVCVDIAGGALRLEKIAVSNPSGIGVRLQDGAAPMMREILVNDTAAEGIVFAEGATGHLAESNILRSGSVGLAVLTGAAPHIETTTIADSAAAGVLYARGASGRFIDNAIAASTFSGIEISTAASPEITGNTIAESGQAGIYLHGAGSTILAGNKISDSKFTGILAVDATAVEVRDNFVENSGEHGMLLLQGSKAQVSNNSILDNAGFGIGIEQGADAVLDNNRIQGNKDPQIQRDGVARVRPQVDSPKPEAKD